MDFKDLADIKDELTQISKTYEFFDEDKRLNCSKAARVEFLTSVHFIEQHLKSGYRILDVGGGAGEYSLHFAAQGYEVCALELADKNIEAFRRKITPACPVALTQGNAMDLSLYEDGSFDVVLLFGPLYHLHKEEDRQKCITEAKRVCKDGGAIFFAFISNDMVVLTEFSCYAPRFFLGDDYDHETFKVKDFPFVFSTVDDCRRMLLDGGVQIIGEVAADGMSELLQEKINAMDKESYRQYLRYHLYACQKPELLGYSNHLLFIGRK